MNVFSQLKTHFQIGVDILIASLITNSFVVMAQNFFTHKMYHIWINKTKTHLKLDPPK